MSEQIYKNYYYGYPWKALPNISVSGDMELGVILDGYWDKGNAGYNVVCYVVRGKFEGKLVRYLDTSIQRILRVRHPPAEYNNSTHRRIMENPLTYMKEEIYEVPVPPTAKQVRGTSEKPLGATNISNLEYFVRKLITPGGWYRLTANGLELTNISYEKNKEIQQQLLGETYELVELALENFPILDSQIPTIPKVAFDIEVNSPKDVFPVPHHAEYNIISIGIAATDGNDFVLVLGDVQLELAERNRLFDEVDGNIEVIYFSDENSLIAAFFTIISKYPIVISFNGDTFDLPYLYYRAQKLHMVNIPIMEQSSGDWQFIGSIHVDIYRFFKQPSIRMYAFGGKYEQASLDAIAEALLGVNKVEHELWFDQIDTFTLVKYNLIDARLTLQLLTFQEELVWILLITLMRLGKMTIGNLTRRSISAWINQWVAYGHERRNYLIPTVDEIKTVKGGFESSAGIDGKQYQGGIVLHPQPGVWWDVVVYDFASLYPSAIKAYNLSYDSIRCSGKGHELCQQNKIPGLSHWVCKRRAGIMSSLVGYVRDLRVKWYKKEAKKATGEKKLFFKMITASLKVFINASYGVFGAETFPLFCPPAAESIAAYARNALLTFREKVENRGIPAIYGDTDSLFLYQPKPEIINEVVFEMLIQHSMELGIDYAFKVLFLSDKKKNYFGFLKEGGVIVKGLSGKKSNTPTIVRNTFTAVLDIYATIKNEEDFARIREEVIKVVQSVIKKLQRMEYHPKELQTMYKLNKKFDEFKSKTPGITIALQKCAQQGKRIHDIKEGSIFFGVFTHKFSIPVIVAMFPNLREQVGDLVFCSVKAVDDVMMEEIDWNHYITILKSTITPLLSPLAIDWEQDLLGQQSLMQFL